MEDLILRFPHLLEKIFEKLDNRSLTKCREVKKSWRKFIDERRYPWIRIVDIPTKLQEPITYLDLAAKTGQIEIFYLIMGKEDAKNQNNEMFQTPFLLACEYGHVKIAEMLMKNSTELNIDLNAKTKLQNGKTAFQLACEKGQSETTKMLMKNSTNLNIDLNITDNGGSTAFHFACKEGHLDIVEMLMKSSTNLNIDLNAKDNRGRTAFHFTCWKGKLSVAKMLMKNSDRLNIDLNAKDENDGWTAFHFACLYNKTNIVEMMIGDSESFKFDFTVKDKYGCTGLDYVQQRGISNMFDLIESIELKMTGIAE